VPIQKNHNKQQKIKNDPSSTNILNKQTKVLLMKTNYYEWQKFS
jgi:hypothetical protein